MVDDVENARVGRQVALLRGDTPQAAIAQAMQKRGHAKWSQSTVWSVEKGTRPLRLTEARDLADILGEPLTSLLATPAEARLALASQRASKHFEGIQRETLAYLKAVRQYRFAADAAEAAGVELGRRRWLEEQPERAVEIARFTYEAERDVREEKYAVVTEPEVEQDG